MRHLLVIALAIAPSVAFAHGSLPQSERPLFHGGQMTVSTRSWGLFLGPEGGPFDWICDEAVNNSPGRLWAMTGDGTYLVTDLNGVDASRDGGCTFTPSTGELATRPAAGVFADPVSPTGAWTATFSSTAPWNAVFHTTDDGATWSPVFMADEDFQGLALSPDGQTIYALGLERHPAAGAQAQYMLHVSQDGGATFSTSTVGYTISGAIPFQLRPAAVDPNDPSTAYLLAADDSVNRALVKVTGYGTAFADAFTTQGDLFGVAFDTGRGAILLGSSSGLVRSTAGGPFQPVGGLSVATCVVMQGETLYVCASNYSPDFAAVARSDDGGDHFRPVFVFNQTRGPLTTCPASSPVTTLCPSYWGLYAEQLGVVQPTTPDAGASPPPPSHSGGCALVGPAAATPVAPALLAIVLLAFALRPLPRRAARGTSPAALSPDRPPRGRSPAPARRRR